MYTELPKLKLLKMQNSKAWPIIEAQRIYQNIGGKTPTKGFVLFETGYGPSGLPHIGTFGEVVRTCFVKFAFEQLYPDIPTKLYCISDDIDGMRKIPDNIPNKDLLIPHLKKPLTSVPDPFGETSSYGDNMNARLRAFLDSFGFQYEFISATQQYKSGKYNETMECVIEKYDEIIKAMLPTLGEDRQKTYSPFMPICNETGVVLENCDIVVNQKEKTLTYTNSVGKRIETTVLNGNCKLQWKVDFGARWHTFGVDYEIFGKDHQPNEGLYKKLCQIIGSNPPITFVYELFLGEDGAKISKSKGNGISVEEWLSSAPWQSLALFMFQKPKTAKKLYFESIPKAVDEYIAFVSSYHNSTQEKRHENPVYFINNGNVSHFAFEGVSYSLLLNLACVCNPESDAILWGFLQKYNANLYKGKYQFFDEMVERSINYYKVHIAPHKKYEIPTEWERILLLELLNYCKEISENEQSDVIQNKVYSIGTNAGCELKHWFSCIYRVLLGQAQGPRVGSFIALYGAQNMVTLIEKRLA